MRRRLQAAAAAFVCLCIAAVAFAFPAAADEPPYTDYQVRGHITFYDRSNGVVTSGDINARPFVWRAVGSEPAPAAYAAAGGKATLLAYIPREGANVGDWTGEALTLSTAYDDPAHPKAQASSEDFSLADFFDNLPPRWNGFVQLRMYYSRPDAPPVTQGYASTDIQVTGTTWTVVRGGAPVEEANPPGPVADTSPADSTTLLGSSAPGGPATGQPTDGSTPGSTPSDGSTPLPSGSAGTTDGTTVDPLSAQPGAASSHLARNVTAAVLLLLLAGIGAFVVIVRIRGRGADPISPRHDSSTVKEGDAPGPARRLAFGPAASSRAHSFRGRLFMRSRHGRFAISLSALSVVAALLAWVTVATSSPAGAAGPTSPDVPYSPDAQSQGALRFYNSAGVAVTGGSVDDAPFATYVVADAAGTHAGDTKATLYIYTPVQGQTPAQWLGNEQMSGSTAYPVPGAPAPIAGAKATSKVTVDDVTLGQAIDDKPNVSTSFAGLYELRMVTSFPTQANVQQYYSADIKVTGRTWALVNPVPAAPVATATTTSLTASPAYGATTSSSVTLSATVSPSAAGSVQFKDGAANIGSAQAIAAGGTASVSTTFATAGSKSLTAVFTPTSTTFSASTGTLAYVVTAAAVATTTTLTASPQTGGPSNSPVTLTATVTPSGAAGTVQFFDGATSLGSAPVASGTATLTGSLFTQGSSHSITAVFTPTNSALVVASTSAAVIVTTVAPATVTSTVLAVNPTSGATTTSSITLTATVAPEGAVGSVQFKDGAANIGSPAAVTGGIASLPTVLASSGSHSLTAVFAPTVLANFTSSTSAAVTYSVATTATTTALSANPTSAVANTPISLQATVTPSVATGTVQFRDGANAIGSPVAVTSGSATLPWSQFGTGNHSVTAVFTPTGSVHATSTSPLVQVVMSAPPTVTTTTLTAAPTSGSTTTTAVTLTAAVVAADALNGTVAGSVQFKNGGVDIGSAQTVAAGTASVSTTFSTASAKSLTAVFTPSDATKFAASTGALTFSVTATATTTTLAVSPVPVTSTAAAALTATVAPAAAAGTVQFRDGATALGGPATVTGGVATLTGQSLSLGSHSLTAVFTPADATVYAASTSAASVVGSGCGPSPTEDIVAKDASGDAGPVPDPGGRTADLPDCGWLRLRGRSWRHPRWRAAHRCARR